MTTDTLLVKRVHGCLFGVEVSAPKYDGDLANGARGYKADVAFYRDGARVGSGRWDAEGFEDCVDGTGKPLDLFPGGDEGDVYSAMATEVRGYLARLEPKRSKPERVEAEQPWRVAGEARDLEVASVADGEATLRVQSLSTGEWVTWGHAPVESMLTLPSWTFLGDPAARDNGGLVLAL